jgi:hypothetical protein
MTNEEAKRMAEVWRLNDERNKRKSEEVINTAYKEAILWLETVSRPSLP